MNTTVRSVTPALLAASLLMTASAFAAPRAAQSEAPSVTVRLNDLDMTAAPGAEVAYARIAAAAQRVCPPLISSNIQATARMSRCVHKALADGIAMVNQPVLTALYVARTEASLAGHTAMAVYR